MTTLSSPSLLGLPGYLDREEAQRLGEALRRTWRITVGQEPASLDQDLELSRRWFDPVAQGQRLRRELAELPAVPAELHDPGPPITISVGQGRRLVTPEGRCVLDFLENLAGPRASYVINDSQLVPYDRILGALYQKWSRHRLKSVVALLAGTTKPLQIPAAGVVVALLVNRCTAEDRALTRFASGRARDVVDRAFFAPVQTFSDVLAPSRRGNRSDPKLVSGWMLYEARRRLGDGLVVMDARGGIDGKVWIRPASVGNVVDVIARDLARGHRARATPERLGEAFDALVSSLRAELPKLAGFGLVHERPMDTQRLRGDLLQALSYNLHDAP
jgi:hypothetical protein